jgi:hypothetical protein
MSQGEGEWRRKGKKRERMGNVREKRKWEAGKGVTEEGGERTDIRKKKMEGLLWGNGG